MPLSLSVNKYGDDVLVYASNPGPDIVLIERMILEINQNHWLFIREGGFFDFYIGGGRLEQNLTHLKFRIKYPSATKAKATAEFIEVTERAETPLVNL